MQYCLCRCPCRGLTSGAVAALRAVTVVVGIAVRICETEADRGRQILLQVVLAAGCCAPSTYRCLFCGKQSFSALFFGRFRFSDASLAMLQKGGGGYNAVAHLQHGCLLPWELPWQLTHSRGSGAQGVAEEDLYFFADQRQY